MPSAWTDMKLVLVSRATAAAKVVVFRRRRSFQVPGRIVTEHGHTTAGVRAEGQTRCFNRIVIAEIRRDTAFL